MIATSLTARGPNASNAAVRETVLMRFKGMDRMGVWSARPPLRGLNILATT